MEQGLRKFCIAGYHIVYRRSITIANTVSMRAMIPFNLTVNVTAMILHKHTYIL